MLQRGSQRGLPAIIPRVGPEQHAGLATTGARHVHVGLKTRHLQATGIAG